jgi:hypothetical protein
LADFPSQNICISLAVTLELRAVGKNPTSISLKRILRVLQLEAFKLRQSGFDNEATPLTIVTAVAEAAMQLDIGRPDCLAALLRRYLPEFPNFNLASRHNGNRRPYLKAYCLRAALSGKPVALVDLADATIRKSLERESSHYSGEASKFKRIIERLLPWYQLWADTCVKTVGVADIVARIEEAKQQSATALYSHEDDELFVRDDIADLWLASLIQASAFTPAHLGTLDQWRRSQRRPLTTGTMIGMARIIARADPSCPLSLLLASETFALLEDYRENAQSKANSYIGISRAVLAASTADAEHYFNRAVEATSRIGEENIDRWGALLDLAERAGDRKKPDAKLAYRLSRCAELTYEYVDRDKHFDWGSTISALVSLCPPSSLTILSRWRDRRFGRIGRSLAYTIEKFIAKGHLPASVGLILLPMDGEWDPDDVLGNGLASFPSPLRQNAAEYAIRYLRLQQLSAQTWQSIKSHCETYRVADAGLDDIIAYEVHREAVSRQQEEDPVYDLGREGGSEESKSVRDWDGIFAGLSLTDAADLSLAYMRFKEGPIPWDTRELFAQLFARTATGDEATVIACLSNMPVVGLFDLRNALESVPDAWRSRGACKAAIANLLRTMCRRHCLDITKSRQYQILPISAACELAGVEPTDLYRDVVVAISQLPDLLDAGRLFTLNGLLADLMTPEEAASALSLGLDLFDTTLEDKDGDGPWTDDLAPPNTVDAALAGYLWA